MSPLLIDRTIIKSLLFGIAVSLVATTAARAQVADESQPPPAYIASVEGSATIDRQGDVIEAVANMPLVPGDRLRTTDGRVEIRFPDGSGIEVAEQSEVEVLSAMRVRVVAGAMDRYEPEPVQARSAQYLPQDLQTYGGTFDQYGAWQYMPEYGYVWYPRVAADWRPYYNGYWDSVPTYGWTWIGLDRWAWPTHHYGRWGYARNAWFWIPGRSFAAAWVSWGYADPYVSWCPLGFDNRPVFALSIGFGNAWRGWTVVRRGDFGYRGRYTQRYAVSLRDVPRRAAFVTQRTAPIAPRFNGSRTYRDARGYGGSSAYGGSRGYGQSRTYGQPRGYGQSPTYGQSRSYGPSRGDAQPRAYGDPRAAGGVRRGDIGPSSGVAVPRYGNRSGVAPSVPSSPGRDRAVQPGQRAPYQMTPRREYPQAMPRSSYPSAAPAPRSGPQRSSPRIAPQVMPRQSYPQAVPRAREMPAPRSAAPQAPRSSPRMSAPQGAPRQSAPRSVAPRSGGGSRDGGGSRGGGGSHGGGRRRG